MIFAIFLAAVVVALIVGGLVARYCRGIESESLPEAGTGRHDERQLRSNVIQMMVGGNQ